MTSTPERLSAALADRYRIERELGQGGMATVYLAEDLKHHRKVAIKVLRPELAAALGSERFLQEIETTANLRHPHILPLYDSGEAGGLLYYVMPYAEGESLRDRLDRERQLPLDDALRIGREVADALNYAHSRSVIHRDIKPENVLLESAHAVVADFGIARAVSVAGGERLTHTGLAIGTPQYMSPEQAAGEKDLDGRSDLYSLGCVLYEMLAGEPPYTGPTARAIMARRLNDPVPPLRTVRASVPVTVEQAINRALSKAPADRFATAAQFVEALTGSAPASIRGSRGGRQWMLIAGATGLLVILVATAVIWSRRSTAPPLDPGLMAVFPFRVRSTDSTYVALREGMVDFLEVKFSGSGGAHVVPARTALAAWHRAVGPQREDLTEEEAREVARRLGAGVLVLGTIVATPDHLLLNGSLLDTEVGRLRAEAKVEGTPDSLLPLIDRFAAQLAAQGAGEQADRLTSLTSTSLPALYAFLAGQTAHRAGQYDRALRYFERALELDSTFARAALGYRGAVAWADGGDGNETRSLRLAWTYRDRLSPRDLVLLNALAGSRYPSSTPLGEQLDAWQEAARQVPDDPDVWVNLGDRYFHDGAQLGVEEPLRRAAEAFNRALALDTTLNVEPMIHLLNIAMIERDTTAVRRLVNRFPEDVPGSAVRRLQAAVVLGDSTMLAAALPEFDSMGSTGDMAQLLDEAQMFGFGIQEAERVVPLYLKRLRTQSGHWRPYVVLNFYENLGRPAAAAAAAAQIGPTRAEPTWASQATIAYALYRDGDPTAAAEAAARIAPSADGPLARDPATRENQYWDICMLARWRLAHGDTRAARAGIGRLAGGQEFHCNVLLEALLAAAERRADAPAALKRLEALFLAGEGRWFYALDVARLREARGDLAGALRAIRRRPVYGSTSFLSIALREEGRLAALAGDREGAIKAYRHYLVLRYSPEHSVRPEVDRVRAELARLVGEPAQ